VVRAAVSRLALGPIQPPVKWVVEVLSPEIKQPGHEADHPSRLSVNGAIMLLKGY